MTKLWGNNDMALLYNKNPICPFCGCQQESTDIDFMLDKTNELETECDVCNKEFIVSRDIEVTYTTYTEDK